jgi:glycogen phosphorylase
MVKFINSYYVIPSLPKNLEKLRQIAYNLYWSWNSDAKELFKRLDRELWVQTGHNPILMLGKVSQSRLEEASHDDGFKSHLNRVYDKLQYYLNENTWFQRKYGNIKNFNIIYFSAEFGLAECLQTYSGGLGVLAGDHLKAASDLGIPLIGIGLLYKVGYFQQYLNSDGWQHERYETNDFDNLPISRVFNENKEPLISSINFDSRQIFFQIWKIKVGRIPLFMLDTNVPQNTDSDKKITETLYGGNAETRIQQEIILGVGGIKALKEMGISSSVCHMNEGHSAFLSLERIKNTMQENGLNFDQAKEVGYYSNIFTTHTPVPAGIDVFPNELVEKYFSHYYKDDLKISGEKFYGLGSLTKDKGTTVFNMAHLAMNTAGYLNGVSKLHSKVSKKMWSFGFPDVPSNEIPIEHVTNGIHIRSHISREMEDLMIQYLGEKWLQNSFDEDLWSRVDKIPDEEIWRIHERRREKLVSFARKRLKEQIQERGGSLFELEAASEVLDPSALTIGFARRFATYKRATLIFRNAQKILDILSDVDKPVQIIISGKAHPKDEEGKKFIQEIVEITKEAKFRRRIVFLENYDLNVASFLVQGCDVWLNNPRRPLEASGTSGMKVILNGGLNFSVLDGWWDEAFDPTIGWKIGSGEEYSDHDYQDEVESRQIYNILETQIIPLFYSRGEDNLPRIWINMIKNSIKKLGYYFNTHRMVEEYCEKFYIPSYKRRDSLLTDSGKSAKDLSAWKEKVKDGWSKIKILKVESPGEQKQVLLGEEFIVNAEIDLGELKPADVEVQIYFGPVEKVEDPELCSTVSMTNDDKKTENETYKYSGSVISNTSGQTGFTIRIIPKHDLLINPFDLGLVLWKK